MATTEARAPGGVRRVCIEGPMTVYEAPEHKRELLAALAEGDRLEIDLSAVDDMDSSGLQLLVLAMREAVKAGKPAVLVAHSAVSRQVLDCYRLGPDFGREPAARTSW